MASKSLCSQRFPRSKRKSINPTGKSRKRSKICETIVIEREEILTIEHGDAGLDQTQSVFQIPDYWTLRAEDRRWESEPHFISQHYKYSLIVRPNGLVYNEGYGDCIGIWFRPLPGDKDDSLVWPAQINLSLTVKSFAENSSKYEAELKISKKCTWDRHATKFRYPAFHFGLTAIKNATIEEARCVVEGVLTIVIQEETKSEAEE